MLPSILAKEIIKGLQAYVVTGFETPTPFFKGIFSELVTTPGRFYKGPYPGLQLPFQAGDAGKDFFASLTTEHEPWLHQQQAWQRLASDRDAASTLIATGTGSGKTECFLYPLLDHCARHPGGGVKAVVIYPMNALATDQARRFARVIHGSEALKGRLRVGLFVGGMEENPSKSMSAESIITDKNVLREQPPDILLTNYKMLDFLLLRPRDQPLWRHNGADTLRYLVVDELHSFDGAQGTDLACLIRRLKARLLPQGGDRLVCVGTSATLGDAGQQQELIRYAKRIFQSDFSADSIIGESRQSAGDFLDQPIEYLFQPREQLARILDFSRYAGMEEYLAAQYRLFFPALGEARISDPAWRVELGESLKAHLLFNNLLRVLGDAPRTMAQVADALVATLPQGEARESAPELLDALCALIAIARDEAGQPLLNLRLQLWVRELRRMVAPIRNDAENKGLALQFADDLKPQESGIHLPLVQCNHCHATAWLSRKNQSSQQVETNLRVIYNDFFRQQPEALVLLPLLEDEKPPRSKGHERWLCGHCGQLQSASGACAACGEADMQRVFVPDLIHEKTVNGNPRLVSERNCPVCGQRDSLLVFGARSASLSSVAIHHSYASPFNDDKKLIAFSDNVQDAAHRAGFFTARTWQTNVRMAIAQALPKKRMGLTELYRHLPRYWMDREANAKAMDEVGFIAEFIAPNMQYYRDFVALENTGRLPADSHLVDEVSRRLEWEVMAEFGYRAAIGRSLERTGVASLGFDLDLLQQTCDALLPALREQEGLRALTVAVLRRFVLGVLLRMRQRGAIDHPELRGYIANGGKSYLLGRISWMPDFHPNSPRPMFLAAGRNTGEFDALLLSKGQSWYQGWFHKTLGAAELLMADRMDAPVLARLIEALQASGLLRELECRGEPVWALNPDHLFVSTDVALLETAHARDRLHLHRAMAAWVDGMPSMDLMDEGVYRQQPDSPSWLSHLYREGDIRRVIAREHTGLLDRETRQQLEADFLDGSRPWQPNLLSATPTLEMGIDIGELSSLLLCSVPPSQANYLQRIGRAGRRDGNAFNLTLAAGAPHDLYFYADPEQMMAGRVEAPGVFLNASAVISRQLTAYCMDRWVASGISADAIPKTLKPVLDSVEQGNIHHFPYNFLAFVKDQALPLLDGFFALFGDELTPGTRDILQQFILGEGPADGLEMRLVKRLSAMVKERSGFRRQIDQLKRHLDRLKTQPQDEALQQEQEDVRGERKALQSMLRQLNARQALNFLTDEGVIPNYAFPQEGVSLRSVIYRRKTTASEDGKQYDNIVYEYERPGENAIRELVPRNRFYAGGRKVTVSRVDLQLSEFESWRFCPSCSFSRLDMGKNETAACPRCGDPMWGDSGQRATMLRLKQVMANTSDRDSHIGDDSDDRDPRFYNQQMLVDVPADGIGAAFRIANEELPFGFEFVRDALFREINFGEFGSGPDTAIAGELLARSGFSLCRHCGQVQEKQQGKQPHAYTCPARKGDPEDESHFVDSLYLYREFKSEAMRILLPVFALESADRALNSFIAALQLGLKLKFGGKVDHLRVMTCSEPDQSSDQRRHYLVLYDSVPGGTGYLQDLMASPQALLDVLKRAFDAMVACGCNQEPDKDGCYRCLYAYRNSYGMESTSRTTAVQMLGDILRHADAFETIDSIENIVINPAFDSELEKLFIGALAHSPSAGFPAKIRQQVVRGKPGYALSVGEYNYSIEPQVKLGREQGVAVPCIADFLIRRVGDSAFLPVAVFLDGFGFHKTIIADDSAKRMALVQSRGYRVWSLTWDDIQDHYAGKMAADQSPFAQQLNPGMRPLQDRLLQQQGGTALFKAALQPSLSLLLHYLSQPDDEAWMQLTFVRMLGWFDQQNMMSPQQAARVQANLDQRAPAGLLQCFEASAEVAHATVSVGQSDAGRLHVDCALPLSALQQLAPQRALCNIWLDDRNPEQEDLKPDWQGFLKACNLLQFLPLSGFATARGMASGHYEEIAFGRETDRPRTSRAPEIAEALECVAAEIEPHLSAWFEAGGVPPTVGYEHLAANEEVVAEAELAWEAEKIAGLLEDQMEYRTLFEQQGWQVVLLDTEGRWLDSEVLSAVRGGGK